MKTLKAALHDAVSDAYTDGYRFFMSGMADGFDLLAAEEVLRMKSEGAELYLVAVFPYAGAESHHDPATRDRIRQILSQSDLTLYLENDYQPQCELRRNIYMVDASYRIIGYYNGLSSGTAHCWNYAVRQHLELVNLYEENYSEH